MVLSFLFPILFLHLKLDILPSSISLPLLIIFTAALNYSWVFFMPPGLSEIRAFSEKKKVSFNSEANHHPVMPHNTCLREQPTPLFHLSPSLL